jgi:anti-sigma factor RsiW
MFSSMLNGSCGETALHMSAYVEGELRGFRRLRVARHLARCERCQAILASLRRTMEALRALGQVEPAPNPQLAEAVLARIRSTEPPR